MTWFAAILEDDARRCDQMRACLQEIAPDLEPIFFESAHLMIAWLRQNREHIAFISLDYDLPVRRNQDGELEDLGTGELVADFLCQGFPLVPIIVHSSNATGGLKLLQLLKRAGWPVRRVYPLDDTKWIHDVWAPVVTELSAKRLKPGGPHDV